MIMLFLQIIFTFYYNFCINSDKYSLTTILYNKYIGNRYEYFDCVIAFFQNGNTLTGINSLLLYNPQRKPI